MSEKEFIDKRRQEWKKLEDDIKLFTKKGKKQGKDKIDSFISLYNIATNDLAYAKTNYPTSKIVVFLNELVARAHGLIYSKADSRLKSFFSFFYKGFPLLLNKYKIAMLVSTGTFFVSSIFAFLLVLINVDNYLIFLPAEAINSASGTGDHLAAIPNFMFSSIIGTNNIQVSFLAFALGITFGIGTMYILITNGFNLGALAGLVIHYKNSTYFWALILPHGVSELFAIFVSGAAGLVIGYALINPGKLSRRDSLIIKGIDSLKLTLVCIPILIVSAIIEGYFTPMNIDHLYKYLFALAIFVLLAMYLTLPLRKKRKAKV